MPSSPPSRGRPDASSEGTPLADDGLAGSRLADGLARAGFTTVALLTRLAADHDLSLTQVRVLAILRDRRLRMSELADHLGLERSTLSGLVDRAEGRGLLRRVPDTRDRRAVAVELTPAGQTLAATGAADFAAGLAPLTDRLTAAEQVRLAVLLERLLDRPTG